MDDSSGALELRLSPVGNSLNLQAVGPVGPHAVQVHVTLHIHTHTQKKSLV